MSSFLFNTLFVVTVLSVMLIIQSIRFARVFKENTNNQQSTFTIAKWVLFNTRPHGFKACVILYVSLLSGHYVSEYKKYLDSPDSTKLDKDIARMSTLAQSFDTELFVPYVIVPTVSSLGSTDGLNEAIKDILTRVSGGLDYRHSDPALYHGVTHYCRKHDISFTVVSAMLEVRLEGILDGSLQMIRVTG